MKIPLPPLWAIAVVGLFCLAFYFGVSETVRQQQQARKLVIERSVLRAIDYICAPWKADRAAFNDCGVAYRVYERCEAARYREFDRGGPTSDAGITCEHPVYKFHEREQAEIEQAERSAAQQRR
jgi:hypothetical protein